MEQVIVQNNYIPTRSGQIVHASSARWNVLVGGLGSSKSKTIMKEVERSALDWPGLQQAVYRKTMPALRDSFMNEFRKEVTAGVGFWKEKIDQFVFHSDAKDPSFVNFRGLDEPDKVKSTEYGTIILEEADEFTEEDFEHLDSRVRQKGAWPLRIFLLLNPVDEDHWIYRKFVRGAKQYQENGGLLVQHFSTRENAHNLPKGYIEQRCVGKTPDEIARYIDGQWGTIVKGKAVYADVMNPQVHLRRFDKGSIVSLLRGWDFGFNRPVCSFRVVDPLGRMNAVHTMMGDKELLDVFADKVKQETAVRGWGKLPLQDYGDPRGHDHSQTSSVEAQTAFDILQRKGIHAIGERGTRSYVEPGIAQVRRELCELVQGFPRLTIDPDNTLLRAAYFGRYVRDDDGSPKKDKYYDNVADADRMISHHHKQQDAVRDAIEKEKLRRSQRAVNKHTGY